MSASCRARLLVAVPPLDDSNFARTVVYVLEHTPEGAIGVVLNRPLETDCPGELHRWAPLLSPPSTVFEGGPVEPRAVIGLARCTSTAHLGDDWHLVDATHAISTVDLTAAPPERDIAAFRLYSGYSGWAPLQLDHELAAGGWIVLDAEPDDPFTTDPGGLWRRVLRRQGGRLAWIAGAPDDLSTN